MKILMIKNLWTCFFLFLKKNSYHTWISILANMIWVHITYLIPWKYFPNAKCTVKCATSRWSNYIRVLALLLLWWINLPQYLRTFATLSRICVIRGLSFYWDFWTFISFYLSSAWMKKELKKQVYCTWLHLYMYFYFHFIDFFF